MDDAERSKNVFVDFGKNLSKLTGLLELKFKINHESRKLRILWGFDRFAVSL